jgi:hypothetical protein
LVARTQRKADPEETGGEQREEMDVNISAGQPEESR